MEMDILVILMMAFGLFAILMFILFYIYAKKHYNDKHINNDLELIDEDDSNQASNIINEPVIEEITEVNHELNSNNTIDDEMMFIPKKKKDR